MITILDCAYLSGHVYHPTHTYLGKNISVYDQTRKINASYNNWYRISDVDSFMQPHGDAYAQLYIKFLEGRATDAVISVRGTVKTNKDNLLTDIISWGPEALADPNYDRWPAYYAKIKLFTFRAKEYLYKYFHDLPLIRIFFTGHSLGGAMAQLMTLKGQPHRSIVFNSPGCGKMPSIDKAFAPRVYNINAKYGVINKVGETIGHIFWIDVPNDKLAAKKMVTHFNRNAYRDSQAVNKVANYMVGPSKLLAEEVALGLRLDSYFSTEKGLENTKIYQENKSLLKTYEDVIIAQHSIDNMIRALKLPQNSATGYKKF